MVKAVLFDMDETLIDIPVSLAFKRAADILNLDVEDLWQAYHSFSDRPSINNHFALLKEKFNLSEDLVNEAESVFLETVRDSKLKDGALDLVKSLSKKYKLYIVSVDSVGKRKAQLEKFGLSSFFSGIFTDKGLGINKESPNYYLKVLEKLNLKAKDVVVVGDSLIAEAAPCQKVGIKVILIPSSENDLVTISPLKDVESYI